MCKVQLLTVDLLSPSLSFLNTTTACRNCLNLSYTYLFPGSFSHCVFWEMSTALTESIADLSSSEAGHLSILVWGVIITKSSDYLLGMPMLHTLLNLAFCSRYNTLLLKNDNSKMSKQSLEPF